MHGKQNGACIFRSLTWRTSACIGLCVASQPLEFVVAPRVADTTSCPARAKINPSLPPINPEPKMPTRIQLYLAFVTLFAAQRPTSFCSSSGYRAPCTGIFVAALSI
jgi:hypothetical protein